LAVFLVKLRKGFGIKKDRGGTLKGDAMLFQVPPSFDGIPLKFSSVPTLNRESALTRR